MQNLALKNFQKKAYIVTSGLTQPLYYLEFEALLDEDSYKNYVEGDCKVIWSNTTSYVQTIKNSRAHLKSRNLRSKWTEEKSRYNAILRTGNSVWTSQKEIVAEPEEKKLNVNLG